MVLLVLESVWEFETAGFVVPSNLWEWIPSLNEECEGSPPAESPDVSDVRAETECISGFQNHLPTLSSVLVPMLCSRADNEEPNSRRKTKSFAVK